MTPKPKIYVGECQICHDGKVIKLSKDEVFCARCKSQYSLELHKRLVKKGKANGKLHS